MKIINAFLCDHCGKLYRVKGRCANHEPKCYFNSETKSCASCQFRETVWTNDLKTGRYQACLKNLDIQTRMKTQCEEYAQRDTHDMKEMIRIHEQFDGAGAMTRARNREETQRDTVDRLRKGFIDLINESA